MSIEARRRGNISERGAAGVEAAIILPMFFMLLFGVFEAGRFMNTRQVLTDAAREGARLAVAPLTQTDTPPSDTDILAQVNGFLRSAGITAATLDCSSSAPASHPVVCIDKDVQVKTGLITTAYTRVRVDELYQVLTVPGFFSMLQITLRGEALMRNETSE